LSEYSGMQEMQDPGILALYRLARQEYAAVITEEQKLAVEELKDLSRAGNMEAVKALEQLNRSPNIHPFLKEVLTA
jgi:hypothetical protein